MRSTHERPGGRGRERRHLRRRQVSGGDLGRGADRPIRDSAHPAVGRLGLADVAWPARSPDWIRAPWWRTASSTSCSSAATSSGCTRPAGPSTIQDSSPTARPWTPRPRRRSMTAPASMSASGGGGYQNEYEFFPLLTAANGDLGTFGRELAATVNPMWLLRSMPNNVLCHIGIRHGLKGPNACVTNHSVSGSLAVAEAAAALRAGEADRALAVGHDAPIEPQMVLYYHQLGLLSADGLWPFDARRSGSLLGEGAAALVLETEAAAAARRRQGPRRVSRQRLHHRGGRAAGHPRRWRRARGRDRPGTRRRRDAPGRGRDDRGARQRHPAVGCVGGARPSAGCSVPTVPPVTAFKWAFGHPLAASGILDSVLALMALRHGVVPGVATLRELDPDLGSLPVSARPQAPRSDVALVLNRGFGGSNTALVLRAAAGEAP